MNCDQLQSFAWEWLALDMKKSQNNVKHGVNVSWAWSISYKLRQCCLIVILANVAPIQGIKIMAQKLMKQLREITTFFSRPCKSINQSIHILCDLCHPEKIFWNFWHTKRKAEQCEICCLLYVVWAKQEKNEKAINTELRFQEREPLSQAFCLLCAFKMVGTFLKLMCTNTLLEKSTRCWR